jgi:hypothetical protein
MFEVLHECIFGAYRVVPLKCIQEEVVGAIAAADTCEWIRLQMLLLQLIVILEVHFV